MDLDFSILLEILCNVKQNESTFLDVLRVIDINSHENFEGICLFQEFDSTALSEL